MSLPLKKRYLMSQYQLKNFLVDLKYDYLYTNLITAERQEVIISLSDFIRICNEEFPKDSTTSTPIIKRDLTVNGYPIILYTGVINYLPKLVNGLDLLREQIMLITDGKKLSVEEIHDELNYKLPNVVKGFKREFGYLISLMYECFLLNTVVLNARAMRMPFESKDLYAYVMDKKVIQPIKFVPKLGPEISCLVNTKLLDSSSFDLARSFALTHDQELFATLGGNLGQVNSITPKYSKIMLDELLYYKGIEAEDLSSYETFYIVHASKVTDSEETLNDIGDYITSLSNHINALITIEADLRSFNEKDLKYLVDFE